MAPMTHFLHYRAGGMRRAIEFGRSLALAKVGHVETLLSNSSVLVCLSRLNSLLGPQRIPPALQISAAPGHLGGPKCGLKLVSKFIPFWMDFGSPNQLICLQN